jgi:methyltransferase family protein
MAALVRLEPYESDKPFHTFAGKSYLDVYGSHLDTINVRDVLELGVLKGHSLLMWRNAFPSARIVGLDIDPGCAWPKGCEVVIGSQDDAELLSSLGEFDVVVDDASHINELTLASFRALWPKVRPGGMYAIEDLDCSYVDLTEISQTWPGMNHVTGPRKNNRKVINDLLFGLIKAMDNGGGDVAEVQFTYRLCIIRKVP